MKLVISMNNLPTVKITPCYGSGGHYWEVELLSCRGHALHYFRKDSEDGAYKAAKLEYGDLAPKKLDERNKKRKDIESKIAVLKQKLKNLN